MYQKISAMAAIYSASGMANEEEASAKKTAK